MLVVVDVGMSISSARLSTISSAFGVSMSLIVIPPKNCEMYFTFLSISSAAAVCKHNGNAWTLPNCFYNTAFLPSLEDQPPARGFQGLASLCHQSLLQCCSTLKCIRM